MIGCIFYKDTQRELYLKNQRRYRCKHWHSKFCFKLTNPSLIIVQEFNGDEAIVTQELNFLRLTLPLNNGMCR